MADGHFSFSGIWGSPERLLNGVALLGGLVLFALVLLVSTAVFARYVLNQPILGDQELVEIGMSLVVMAAMPLTTFQNGHIRVDILDHRIGDTGQVLRADVFARVVSCIVSLSPGPEVLGQDAGCARVRRRDQHD